MKKRLVSVVLVAAFAFSMLAGCGSDNSASNDNNKTSALSFSPVILPDQASFPTVSLIRHEELRPSELHFHLFSKHERSFPE